MNKKIRDHLFVFNNVLWVITTAVVLTLVVAPCIHQMDVEKYALDVYSGLSTEQIKSEFSHLVGYLWLWHRQPLQLSYFPMSQTGIIHFAEVKVFVDWIQIIWIITTIFLVIGTKKRLQKKEILFLKQTAMVTCALLGTLFLVALVAFDRLFVIFHQIVFRNEYWIFSTATDPVIKILPEEFFMHGFFAIVAFVLVLSTVFLLMYKYYIKPIKVLE